MKRARRNPRRHTRTQEHPIPDDRNVARKQAIPTQLHEEAKLQTCRCRTILGTDKRTQPTLQENLKPNPPSVMYDKGRLSAARTAKFRTYVTNKDRFFEYKGYKRYRGSLSTPIDVSSSEAGIWAADNVAGGVLPQVL